MPAESHLMYNDGKHMSPHLIEDTVYLMPIWQCPTNTSISGIGVRANQQAGP